MSFGVVRSLFDPEREDCGHWHRSSLGVSINRSVLFHVGEGHDRYSLKSASAFFLMHS